MTSANKPRTKAEIEEENSLLRAQLEAAQQAASTNAVHNPVIINRTVEPLETQAGDGHVAIGKDDSSEIIVPRSNGGDGPQLDDEKLANMAFDNEPVTVMIHKTTDKLAPKTFPISVNGKTEIFAYGETKTVKRMFVEGLMRAKPTNYRNEEFTNEKGIMDVRWPSNTGLRFNFSIVKDSNPNSEAWMKSIMAQP